MKYFDYFKSVVTFKNYPLFRAAHFRYLMLNIFIISILIALPHIITLFQTVQTVSGLDDIADEIPQFEIVDGEYIGETGSVSIGEDSVFFTGRYKTEASEELDDDVLFAFLRDGIYIRDIQNADLDYAYIGEIDDEADLKAFIDRQTSSLYFYMLIYIVFYVSIIMFFTVILMTIGNYIPHLLSLLYKKKTRFMSWFKFSTFVTVLMLIPIITFQSAFDVNLWWLYFLSLPFYYHYFRKIPVDRRRI